MDVINDDAKVGFRRIEVLTGPARRRRWSASEKGRIVAQTLAPGATVTQVARRWQVCPQQVWGWRRDARAGALALPAGAAVAHEPCFVPIVASPSPMAVADEGGVGATDRAARAAPAPAIEVRLAGAVIRVASGTQASLLTAVLRAVRASAA